METFIFILVISLILGSFIFDFTLSVLNYRNRKEPIPEVLDGIYNKERYNTWLNYTMEKYRFGLILSMVNLAVIIVFLIAGLFPLIDDAISSIFDNQYTQILLFVGAFFTIEFLIGLPFSYYNHFSIEERYGFNKSTKKTFILDKIKELIISFILGGALIMLIASLYYKSGNAFYVYAIASLMAILIFFNLFYVKLIVPIFNKLTPLEDGDLKDKITNLTNKVGYELSKVSVIDASKRSTKLNAYFTGLGKFKQIVLFDTLIKKMSEEEIVAVLSHEIGHNKYKHVWFGIFQSFIIISLYLAVLLMVLKFSVVSTAFGFTDSHFGFGLIIFSVFLSPLSILINVLTSWFSRRNEFQADNFAKMHGYAFDLENALKVVVKENFVNLTPHPLYVKMTYSHPPEADRIIALRKTEV